MLKGLNFKTLDDQSQYHSIYDIALPHISVPYTKQYVQTSFGLSHVVCYGDNNKPPLVLLHAFCCSSLIWYNNIASWSQRYCIYSIDLISEASKSILTRKLKTNYEHAKWLEETCYALAIDSFYLCGLSIGAWSAANYASYFPTRVRKLILLSPVQICNRLKLSYVYNCIKIWVHPTKRAVEIYLGWGCPLEGQLPNSILELFNISIRNINIHTHFPKYLGKKQVTKITIPTLFMIGEEEYIFSVPKTIKKAQNWFLHLDLEVVKGAAHLLNISQTTYVNQRVLEFLDTKKQ